MQHTATSTVRLRCLIRCLILRRRTLPPAPSPVSEIHYLRLSLGPSIFLTESWKVGRKATLANQQEGLSASQIPGIIRLSLSLVIYYRKAGDVRHPHTNSGGRGPGAKWGDLGRGETFRPLESWISGEEMAAKRVRVFSG